MKNTVAIILAAGRGTRFKSDYPKVCHTILGKPIVTYVVDALKGAGITKVIAVSGFGNKILKNVLQSTKIVVQKRLLGSGDAVLAAKKALKGFNGDVVVICGDTPLVSAGTIRAVMKRHRQTGADATILTVTLGEPGDYGRIWREAGRVTKVVEAEKIPPGSVLEEVNVGTYCFKSARLFEALSKIRPDNKKREYFLTDVFGILSSEGAKIESVGLEDACEMTGVNTRNDLAESAAVVKGRVMSALMASGVTIEDPASTVIHPGVKIGRDTVIHSNTVIESGVRIGKGCLIGPFARIRPGVTISDKVEIGNFVELVRSHIGRGSRVKHHTYLGDASVGAGVNVGAGTITANYDGKKKHMTVIGDGAFIGVGAILIAPVHIGSRAVVGAGCVVPKNHNVKAGSTVVGVPAKIFKKSK